MNPPADIFTKIEACYKKLHNHLAPLGSYVICALPFFFLYQYAKDNILIEETVYIGLAVALTVFINSFKSGLCFIPVCTILFLALWDKNVVLAIAVAFMAFCSVFFASDRKKGQYVYPILVLILTGCLNRSLLPLMIAYTMTALVFWRDDRTYALIIPICLFLNAFIYGSGTDLTTMELNSILSERIPFASYFKTVLDQLNAEAMVAPIVDLLKQQHKFYVVFFAVLWVGTMIHRELSTRFDKFEKPFAYTLLSCLLCSLIFCIAHASAQIAMGLTPDYKQYISLSLLCILISTVLSLFIKTKEKPRTSASADYDVFISYSHKDIDVAKQICATLENEGIGCWYAPRNIPAGAEWASAIMEAIKHAKIMVVVFSDFSNSSVQVRREIDNAISNGVTIIPLKLTNTSLSESLKYYLSTVHWFDATNKNLEIAIQDMTKTISSHIRSSKK